MVNKEALVLFIIDRSKQLILIWFLHLQLILGGLWGCNQDKMKEV